MLHSSLGSVFPL
ncbi:unnamed protein product, partial [Linum tenue]